MRGEKMDYEYAGIKITAELKKAIKEIAVRERRAFGKQALIILELGMEEFKKREEGKK